MNRSLNRFEKGLFVLLCFLLAPLVGQWWKILLFPYPFQVALDLPVFDLWGDHLDLFVLVDSSSGVIFIGRSPFGGDTFD